MEVDVAIVGAGPAGSCLAMLLARRGAHVALIDRDTFPRDKVCGEFLSYDALPILDRLGLTEAIDAAGAVSISRCRIVSDSRGYEFSLPAVARGISRFTLDRLLFETAIAAGAQRLDGWTADLDPTSRHITIRRDGDSRTVAPRVIVGAWGRWGRIDRVLERSFMSDRGHRYFGFKRHYRGSLEPEVIELHSFRKGYLGVAGVENGLTNICGLVHHSRLAGLKGGWESFTQALAAEEQSLRRLFESNQPADEQFLSSDPVIFVPKSPLENGIFMIGDAAGLIDPLTGSGMAIAVQSALLAARPVLDSLSRSNDAEESYRESFRRFFGRRLWWSRRIAYLLCRPWLVGTGMRAPLPHSLGRFLVERTRAEQQQLDRVIRQWFGSV